MILRVVKRVSPVLNQSRYRVRYNSTRSRGALLDECLSKVGAMPWLSQVDAALIAGSQLHPKAQVISLDITTQ